MKQANYKYEFLKTYRSLYTFMKMCNLYELVKVEDEERGEYRLIGFKFPTKRSRKLQRTHHMIHIATTATTVPLEEVRISLVKHPNTTLYPEPFWLVHN
jgi:hypothetical protein